MKVLEDFPVTITLDVEPDEIDIYGHVNNIHYFKYFEKSRIAYMKEIGFYDRFAAEGIAGVLSRADCNFLMPIKHPDLLTVGARVSEISPRSILMEYFVSSVQNGLCAFGESELIIFDFNENKKMEVPGFLRESIEELEKRKF